MDYIFLRDRNKRLLSPCEMQREISIVFPGVESVTASGDTMPVFYLIRTKEEMPEQARVQVEEIVKTIE